MVENDNQLKQQVPDIRLQSTPPGGSTIARVYCDNNNFYGFSLTLESSQNTFAKNNYEYPLRFNKKNSDLISKWGNFKSDEIHLSKLGENNAEAVKLFDKASWE